MARYSPQDLDAIENENLDLDLDDGLIYTLPTMLRGHTPLPAERDLPARSQGGTRRYLHTGRNLPHATLDQIERR